MTSTKQQTVVLKADDIREHPDTLSPAWRRFIDICADSDVAAGLGLIGDALVDPSPRYVDRLRELAADSRFELWNHGFDHVLNRKREDRTTWSEFHDTPIEHQRHHLAETQRLAKERLGLTLTTFGAPGNHIDDTTLTVVDERDDLTVWLYGDPRSRKHILSRTINVEHPTHFPDFAAFSEAYRTDIPVLTLQVHPGGWDDDRFDNFTRILAFLKDRSCRFVRPDTFGVGAPAS